MASLYWDGETKVGQSGDSVSGFAWKVSYSFRRPTTCRLS